MFEKIKKMNTKDVQLLINKIFAIDFVIALLGILIALAYVMLSFEHSVTIFAYIIGIGFIPIILTMIVCLFVTLISMIIE